MINTNKTINLKHVIINDINGKRSNSKIPAIFLDRDGVVIKDCHHIRDPKKVVLLDGVIDLIQKANLKGWLVVIITNQSGISRGIFSWKDYEMVTARMLDLIGKNIIINAIYANGYADNTEEAQWRKPSPGMIYQASLDLNIDLNNSILFGDRLTDLLAGERAGLKEVIHLLTGHGREERLNVIKSKEESKESLKTKVLLIDDLSQFCFK